MIGKAHGNITRTQRATLRRVGKADRSRRTTPYPPHKQTSTTSQTNHLPTHRDITHLASTTPKLTTPTKTSSSHSRNITQSTANQHNFIPKTTSSNKHKKYIMLIKGNKLFDPKNALVKNLTISNFITIYRCNRFPLIIYYSKLALFLE